METALIWVVPISFIPGAGLLIMSTTHRLIYLRQLEEANDDYAMNKLHLKREALLGRALQWLYLSVVMFAAGSLMGGMSDLIGEISQDILMIATCLGILFILAGTAYLFQESRHLVRSLKK